MSDDAKEKKIGRPTKYTPELANRICKLIATTTFSIRKLCALYDDLPEPSSIYCWLIDYSSFSEQYARAKEAQVEVRLEEIDEVVCDNSDDFIRDEKTGRILTNTVGAARMRERVAYYKWSAERLRAKKYGLKTQSEVTFDDSAIKHVKDRLDDIERK